MRKKLINKPFSRQDYMYKLRESYDKSWVIKYGIYKSDLYEMSVVSLRKLYKKIQRDNFHKLMGG